MIMEIARAGSSKRLPRGLPQALAPASRSPRGGRAVSSGDHQSRTSRNP